MDASQIRTLSFLGLAGTIAGLGYLMVTFYNKELEAFLEGLTEGLENFNDGN